MNLKFYKIPNCILNYYTQSTYRIALLTLILIGQEMSYKQENSLFARNTYS